MTEGIIEGQPYEFPHCNSETLHAPGTCYYCDFFPSRQAVRAASGSSFSTPEANGWSGNIAVKAGEIHEHMGASFVVGEQPPPSFIDQLTVWQAIKDLARLVFTGR